MTGFLTHSSYTTNWDTTLPGRLPNTDRATRFGRQASEESDKPLTKPVSGYAGWYNPSVELRAISVELRVTPFTRWPHQVPPPTGRQERPSFCNSAKAASGPSFPEA